MKELGITPNLTHDKKVIDYRQLYANNLKTKINGQISFKKYFTKTEKEELEN